MKTINHYFNNINKSIIYKIGKNALENDKIIDEANENDIWFHISGSPSSHVIASVSNISLTKRELFTVIKRGGLFCKENTKGFSSEKDVPIVYTKIKYITKTNIIGTVQTINNKVIFL